jgi:glycosyltransferase involved in cell wall biosynthesis
MLGGGEHSFVDLLSRMPAGWEPLAAVPEKGDMWPRLEERKIPTTVVPLPAVRPWRTPEMLRSLKVLAALCRRHAPSLIYANGSRAALYAGIVGRLLGIPVLWHCRIAQRDPYLDPLLSPLSTCIVANSRATAKRFGHRFSKKVNVVYNGVDLAWLRQTGINKPEMLGVDWNILLMVARASKWKRHDLALSAFEQVAGTNPEVHLVCVGERDNLDPGWWRYLQDRSRESPFSSRIHWVGHADDIRPWYRAASLLLLPSDNEPFGRVLVEAMACGVPVVAARGGGVPEILREGQDGLLIAPGNAGQMAEAASRLLRDDLLRQWIIRSSLERAEVFSLDNHVKAMVEVFRACLPR